MIRFWRRTATGPMAREFPIGLFTGSPADGAKRHACHLSTDLSGARNTWSGADYSRVFVSFLTCYVLSLVTDRRHVHILWINVWTIRQSRDAGQERAMSDNR